MRGERLMVAGETALLVQMAYAEVRLPKTRPQRCAYAA
jgi:hypothetical protein